MIFTQHACERYRQFHMMDHPTATDADAAALLGAHQATKLPSRTWRGDEVWTIHALGVELVVKRDTEFSEPVCVTVLPPVRFRGLTPLQAERVEMAAQEAKRLAEEAQREVVTAKAARENSKKPQPQKALETAVATAKTQALSMVVERDILCAQLKAMRVQMNTELTATKLKAALKAALRCARATGAGEVLEAVRAVEAGLASEAFIEGTGD